MNAAELAERLKGFETHELLDALRGRGVAVCAVSSDDVLCAQCDPHDLTDPLGEELQQQADNWLSDHVRQIEHAMSEAAKRVIGFPPGPITRRNANARVWPEEIQRKLLGEEDGDDGRRIY